ncbi:palmitoyl-protein thioesterase family protein [Aspergillus affinis]|uniref:palmitoyl-protein thioesterase family protein n=1 Tax=Aspergillus affinis TaxID=1070780 RepID=UPI0022FF219F|nr:alpha/beta-hydrolase [Aspergillus affinis]KAI9040704.1 alpha/beta-hydrolase [Aspergillus affinis]
MRHLLPTLTLLPILASSLPTTNELAPLPLVIWHGLGDDFQRDGMKEVASLADATNPGTYVHLIHLADSGAADRQASFIGDVNLQVDTVCAQLQADNILRTAPGINALGFSQGGQFLRAYIERCNSPPVHNLVTLGSQHNGIAEFQACGASDYFCRGGEALLRWGRWSQFVQTRLVPAQYFRDPEELEAYLEHSNFLADVNNERELKNVTYKENLARLNRFAMFLFEEDQMVHPKESAWFAEVNATSGEVTPLREREIYKQDWLGLRELDEKGALEFKTVPGGHMQLSEEVLTKLFTEYFAPVEVGDVLRGEREDL